MSYNALNSKIVEQAENILEEKFTNLYNENKITRESSIGVLGGKMKRLTSIEGEKSEF